MKKIEIIAITAIIVGTLTMAWIILGGGKKTPIAPITASVIAPEKPTTEEEGIVAVRVVKAKDRDFEDTLPVLGTIKGYAEIPLKFEIDGVIKTFEVKEGERVKKGDLIATIKDEDSQLRLQYSRKKLAAAEAQYLSVNKKKELYEGMYKAGAVIRQKLEEAVLEAEASKSQVGMAEAECRIAEAEAKKTNLASPKDGIIGSKDAEAGEFVTPQNKVASLYDIEKVYVEIGIVERDIEKVKLGQKVGVQLDSYPQKVFMGKVDNLVPIIEGKSRTLTAKVLLDNPEGLLFPGMFSRVKIYIVELKEALLVPKTSVLTIGPGINIVPIINPGKNTPEEVEKGKAIGTVELRKIETGYATSDYLQVTQGLSAGELIIIETKGELKEGLKVKVMGVEEAVL